MSDLSFFRCPRCASELSEGANALICRGCAVEYPFENGVFDFSGMDVTSETRNTVRQFGESWKIFDHVEPYHEKQFLDWISPLAREDFTDRDVLEGGCGKGRHTVTVLSWRPRKLVAVDLSEAIYLTAGKTAKSASTTLPARNREPVTLIRGDLKRLPISGSCFDTVFSVGVLHHLDEPQAGLMELWRTLKPGGKLLLWVYAKEGNGWILRFVNPVRTAFTSKIPTKLLRVFSLPLTSFLFMLLKLLYGPLTDWGEKEVFLPYSSYLGSISRFPFREIDNIVVDHLCPPVAYYLSRHDLEKMFEQLKPQSLQFRWHHKNSWTVLAVKEEEIGRDR